MKKIFVLMVSLILTFNLTGAAKADLINQYLINPGFETGDFTGWAGPTSLITSNDNKFSAAVVTKAYSYNGTLILPPCGKYFAEISTNAQGYDEMSVGLNWWISPEVSIQPGQTIQGWARADGPGGDTCYVVGEEGYPFILTEFANSPSQWESWTWTDEWPFILDFYVHVGSGLPFRFFFDMYTPSTPSPAPIPGAVFLFGSGILGLAVCGRRKLTAKN